MVAPGIPAAVRARARNCARARVGGRLVDGGAAAVDLLPGPVGGPARGRSDRRGSRRHAAHVGRMAGCLVRSREVGFGHESGRTRRAGQRWQPVGAGGSGDRAEPARARRAPDGLPRVRRQSGQPDRGRAGEGRPGCRTGARRAGLPGCQTIYFGESLGSAVVAALQARRPPAGWPCGRPSPSWPTWEPTTTRGYPSGCCWRTGSGPSSRCPAARCRSP